MLKWIYAHEVVLWWAVSFSIIIFLVTLITVPLVVIKIPPDYFIRKKRTKKFLSASHPVLRGLLLIIKNTLGMILVLMGIIMLFTPGQGLFTIFVGMLLTNFPGKYRFMKWLVNQRSVARSINWLRLRAGCSPLIFPEEKQM